MTDNPRPTRILHITFNMSIGGTEQVIRQLVSTLADADYDNRILCIDGKVGEIGQQLVKDGTKVTALQRNPGFDLDLVRGIRAQIRSFGATVVHCHQYTPWVYGWLASYGTGAKVVFTEHGRFFPDRHRYKAILINPLMALMTPKIIAISSATKRALSRYEFIPRSKIRVIYNGIAPLTRNERAAANIRKSLDIGESDFVMGTVARLDPVKNQAMMLQAFAMVLAENPNCWLLMVGDGPERAALERQAHNLNISHRVAFTGFIEAPANFLAAMDLFLLSSNTEGTSMTLLEAMSLGLPTVATEAGGTPEIVAHAETGLLTPVGNVSAFAEGIAHIIKDKELRQRLGAASVRLFERRFSATSMAGAYSKIYDGKQL
ncbi:glycosyltransferase family 4 protein [Marinobacter sp.]|uniref:glycosyltransferase family 4 protein n=1 Tax=Marinobacter sp. TaxID=50741 RepID=UPI003A8EC4C2